MHKCFGNYKALWRHETLFLATVRKLEERNPVCDRQLDFLIWSFLNDKAQKSRGIPPTVEKKGQRG